MNWTQNIFLQCILAIYTVAIIKKFTNRAYWYIRVQIDKRRRGQREVEYNVQFVEYINLLEQPTGLRDEWHNYCDTLTGNGEYAMSHKVVIDEVIMVLYCDWLTFLQNRHLYAG